MMSLNIMSLISVSVVAVSAQGPCALQATKGPVQVECAIPSSTDMNPKCCQIVQGLLDGTAKVNDPPKDCYPFFKYMQRFSPPLTAGGGMQQDEAVMEGTFMNDLSSMPKGLSCTETILPKKESVCDLNVPLGQLDVTCKLPASTKIDDACCKKVKEQIASQGKKYDDEVPECKEFSNYLNKLVGQVQKKMGEGGPSEGATMENFAMQKAATMENFAMQKIPMELDMLGGLSCTELITGGGTSLSASRAVISAIGLARARSERHVAHYDLAICGVTSFFAVGMLVAGALYINSKKNRKQQLLLA